VSSSGRCCLRLVHAHLDVHLGVHDNFPRRDHSGWAKAGWLLLIVILPLFGCLIYLIARPSEDEAAV
jgi:hypothetical protein